MMYDMIIEFLGIPPEGYEYITYTFAGFAFLITLLVILGFIIVILGGFLSIFKGGGSL